MLSRISFSILLVLGSLVAGALGGFLVVRSYISPQFAALQHSVSEYVAHVTSTLPSPVEVIRVEREAAAPVIPAFFLQNRRPPVLYLVRKSSQGGDVNLFTKDRILGEAVVLTVDGWLLTSASAIEGMRLMDLMIVADGRSYPVKEAVRDTATDLVYLKIVAQDLSVASFAQKEDGVVGLPVWVETVPGRLLPQVLLDVQGRRGEAPVQSERLSRRFLMNTSLAALPNGAAVWNGVGQLMGVVETSDAAGAWVIPTVGATDSLNSWLVTREIRRPTLGVAGIDASLVLSEAVSSTRSVNGFVVRGDRAQGVVAIDAKGPAAKLLKEGDVIERLDRDILVGASDVGEYLAQYRPGTALTVSGKRAGKPFEVTVVLGSVVTSESLK